MVESGLSVGWCTKHSANGEWVFTTYQRDQESGLEYALARYYDSTVARFCSADPLGGQPGDPQSWNRYSYSRNDPVNLVDPSGMGFLSWLTRIFNAVLTFLTGGKIQLPGGATTPPTLPPDYESDTAALFGSINHPADLSGPAVIENWSPDAHDAMIQDALSPCLKPDQILAVQKASRDWDKATATKADPVSVNSHSQMADGQTPAEAIRGRDDFISARMAEAKLDAELGLNDQALRNFGEGIHPVMDAYSPAHMQNGKPTLWNGNPLTALMQGHSPGEWMGKETLADLKNSPGGVGKANPWIRALFRQVFGRDCK